MAKKDWFYSSQIPPCSLSGIFPSCSPEGVPLRADPYVLQRNINHWPRAAGQSLLPWSMFSMYCPCLLFSSVQFGSPACIHQLVPSSLSLLPPLVTLWQLTLLDSEAGTLSWRLAASLSNPGLTCVTWGCAVACPWAMHLSEVLAQLILPFPCLPVLPAGCLLRLNEKRANIRKSLQRGKGRKKSREQ